MKAVAAEQGVNLLFFVYEQSRLKAIHQELVPDSILILVYQLSSSHYNQTFYIILIDQLYSIHFFLVENQQLDPQMQTNEVSTQQKRKVFMHQLHHFFTLLLTELLPIDTLESELSQRKEYPGSLLLLRKETYGYFHTNEV